MNGPARATGAVKYRQTWSSVLMLWGTNPFGRLAVRSARGAVAALLVTGAMTAAATIDAQAAPKSAIVVDGKTGKVLYAQDPDGLRHPASLTKMMTLYILFGALESGKINLNSRFNVSAFASRQSPTKLGLKPGQTIAVRDAMLGLITRSANDAAVVIAENLAGSESAFAARMTATARSIGMSRTTFRNASGLPNPDQWTTARDMTVLGRALQAKYPAYYRYFATRSFVYNGRVVTSHNHLLGRVEGLDGIKTGYTGASGFNLVSSVKRDNRYIVASVMGGASAASRDNQMVGLINANIEKASTGSSNSKSLLATILKQKQATPDEAEEVAAAQKPQAAPQAAPDDEDETASVTPAPRSRPDASDDDDEDAAAPQAAAVAMPEKPRVEPKVIQASVAAPLPDAKPAARSMVLASDDNAAADRGSRMVFRQGPSGKSSARPAVMTVAVSAPVDEEAGSNQDADASAGSSGSGIAGWKVQIAAAPSEDSAQSLLDDAKAKGGKVLAAAKPSVEPVRKGDETFYRARFAGFESKEKARAACLYLKKRDVSCLAIPD